MTRVETTSSVTGDAAEIVAGMLLREAKVQGRAVDAWMRANNATASWEKLERKLDEIGVSRRTVDQIHEELVSRLSEGGIGLEWLRIDRDFLRRPQYSATGSIVETADEREESKSQTKTLALLFAQIILAAVAIAFVGGLATLVMDPPEKASVVFWLNCLCILCIVVGVWWLSKITKYLRVYRHFRKKGAMADRSFWKPRLVRLATATVALLAIGATGATVGYKYRAPLRRDKQYIAANFLGKPRASATSAAKSAPPRTTAMATPPSSVSAPATAPILEIPGAASPSTVDDKTPLAEQIKLAAQETLKPHELFRVSPDLLDLAKQPSPPQAKSSTRKPVEAAKDKPKIEITITRRSEPTVQPPPNRHVVRAVLTSLDEERRQLGLIK
ncbi:MAG: hypothetical protein KW802_02970 [Candidatus Doudnabacteria bacterium]|nr:hypothetical protein [Candidatus Doudnabacteria bacterium]